MSLRFLSRVCSRMPVAAIPISAACLVLIAVAGCSSETKSPGPSTSSLTPASQPESSQPALPTDISGKPEEPHVQKLPDIGHIHNVHQIGDRILTGSQPENSDDLKALKAAGVSIVVSVDGTPPDVAGAHEAGIQYVHVPLGYDGISREEQLSLARVLKDHPAEKVFFHCQHGKHRGPAAAATACRMNGLLTGDQVRDYLKQAGTSSDYVGLWTAAAESAAPQPDEVLPELQESIEPPEIVMMMKEIDAQFRKSKDAALQVEDAPDNFRQSNALLNQLFKESARLPSAESIRDELINTGAAVLKLNDSQPATAEVALQGLTAIEERCTQCHASHR